MPARPTAAARSSGAPDRSRLNVQALAGFVLTAAWLVYGAAYQPLAVARWGGLEGGGALQWRNEMAMATQLIWLPVLFLCAKGGRDMPLWCNSLVRERLDACSWAFVGIFGSYVLKDTLHFLDQPLILIHHAACLAGHAYGASRAACGFPFYFAGVVAFELGSAACNFYYLWPSAPTALVYLLAMLLTNIGAVLCCARAAPLLPASGRVLAFALTVSLALARQLVCFQELYATAGKG